MKRVCLILSVLAAAVASAAAVEDEVVVSSGMGATYRAAVTEALRSAVESHDGVTISANEISEIASQETSVATNGEETDRQKVDSAIARGLKTFAQGRVKSYVVLASDFDSSASRYRVQLEVHFTGKYQVGLPEGNRRRMALATFRPTGSTFSWYGQTGSTVEWVKALDEKLNERLVQTRKFTLLDRAFDAEVNDELARLGDANAAKSDAARLGQKLGTDYLLVGTVRFFPVAAPGVNPLTGQALAVASQPFAEVSYRVLLAPTGQLKWADTVTVDAATVAASSVGAFTKASAEAAAAELVEKMTMAILPLEIVKVSSAARIVLGEGGKSVQVGERYTVYALGETVVDTRTGEALDEEEEPVGTVEVTEVREKLSYARLLEGDLSKMAVGSRLRRVVKPAPVPVEGPLPTTVRPAANGGVNVGF